MTQPLNSPTNAVTIQGVEVVYAAHPRQVLHAHLDLSLAPTVQDALNALPAAWREAVLQLDQSGDLGISIWGKRAGRQARLQEGDRLELCRPLRVDPKVARRERFAQQGKKRPGLFAPKKETP